jgi:hypothetical protein
MPIDIMSPLAASSVKRGGHDMAKRQGNNAVRVAGSNGQFSLGNCLTQDAQVKFVCIPAPNASPPSGPSIGYTVVRIDRN